MKNSEGKWTRVRVTPDNFQIEVSDMEPRDRSRGHTLTAMPQ